MSAIDIAYVQQRDATTWHIWRGHKDQPVKPDLPALLHTRTTRGEALCAAHDLKASNGVRELPTEPPLLALCPNCGTWQGSMSIRDLREAFETWAKREGIGEHNIVALKAWHAYQAGARHACKASIRPGLTDLTDNEVITLYQTAIAYRATRPGVIAEHAWEELLSMVKDLATKPR